MYRQEESSDVQIETIRIFACFYNGMFWEIGTMFC